MGTKITYKSLGHDPKEDYKWVNQAMDNRDKKIAASTKQLKKLLKNPNIGLIMLGRKDVYAANALSIKGQHFVIPEGNPVTYYYSLAYDSLSQITEAQNLLLDSLMANESQFKWNTQVAFSYLFKTSSVCILFSYLALEAFMNQCLPDFANIEFEGKIVDKNTIQRYMTFDDKFKIIIPTVTHKNFITDNPKKVEVLLNLKKLRDQLIHLKENRNGSMAAYTEIYNKILSIDFKKILNTIKFYINSHQPKTIRNYRKPKTLKAKIIHQEVGEDNFGKYIKSYYVEM